MIRSLFIAICTVIILCSCTTRFKYVDSDPIGAEIYVDGEYNGKTPKAIYVPLPHPKGHTVELRKDGYKPVEMLLQRDGKAIDVKLEKEPDWHTSPVPYKGK